MMITISIDGFVKNDLCTQNCCYSLWHGCTQVYWWWWCQFLFLTYFILSYSSSSSDSSIWPCLKLCSSLLPPTPPTSSCFIGGWSIMIHWWWWWWCCCCALSMIYDHTNHSNNSGSPTYLLAWRGCTKWSSRIQLGVIIKGTSGI